MSYDKFAYYHGVVKCVGSWPRKNEGSPTVTFRATEPQVKSGEVVTFRTFLTCDSSSMTTLQESRMKFIGETKQKLSSVNV